MRLDYSKPQYLKHPLEDCVLRTTFNPNNNAFKVFVRWSGDEEYQISDTTNLFLNAFIQEEEITEKEYWDF
ncbi:MAG TPA: hypothetical protein VGK10_20240 [Prolixibacteraceae bacterium]|jgi:hypothetical protein